MFIFIPLGIIPRGIFIENKNTYIINIDLYIKKRGTYHGYG